MVPSRGLRSALLLCLFAVVVPAQPNRIGGAIDARRTVVVRGSVPLRARAQFDRGPVDGDFPLGNITLMLKPSDAQQAELDRLLADLQDPASPGFHDWLTPEAYADRFGASAADIRKISGWLTSQGFTVRYTARGRDFISFSGTAGQAQAAFGTQIHRYRAGAESHFANATDISLPEALAPLIGGVLGLHDFHPRAPHKRMPPNYTAGSGTYYLVPDDFATIYNLSPLYLYGYTGAGQSIVIVGQSDIDPSSIASFRADFNLLPTTIQMMPGGAYPGFSPDEELEADLDLEWAGAVARFANLIYVYSDDADYSAYFAIDNNLAPIISESYGLCEYEVAINRLGLYNYRVEAQKAAAEGITWLASSGDSGAAGCDYQAEIATQGLAVILPSTVPEITAVGGTEFNEGGLSYWNAANGLFGGSALSYIPETSWNDTAAVGGLASGGGGLSAVYPKPSWQTGPGVPNDGARDVPDISLNASGYHDPYVVYTLGETIGVGGTSASAPAFAGILAVLNQYLVQNQVQAKPGLGNINPKLYALAAGGPANVFHDIASGSNLVPCQTGTANCKGGQFGYQASPGYDLATGLGSVDAYNFVTAWAGIPVADTAMTLAATPSTVAPGGSAVLTATVKAASGSRTPTGTVIFTMGSTSLGTAQLSGSGNTATASVTVPGGWLVAAINTIRADYGGNPIFNASAATATLGLGTPAAHSAVTVTVTPNPVVQHAPDANGATFSFTIQLQETAGVATTLSGFSFDGMDFAASIGRFFGGATLAANGSLTATLKAGNVPVPSTVPIVFTGRDASGAAWSQQIAVPFLPASGN